MSEPTSREKRPARWWLETTADGGKSLERISIQNLPFRIGRGDDLELTLPFQSVSKHHATLDLEEEDAEPGVDPRLKLRDLESTNGTFVNRKRVTEALLEEGDILHFGEFEFRLGRQLAEDDTGDVTPEGGTLTLGRLELSQKFVGGTRELNDLIDNDRTTVVFQPIVSLPAGNVVAYEVLGRGLHEDLPRSPKGLFRVAETIGRADELSRLFRRKAASLLAEARADLPLLFLNTHPSEIGEPELVESLQEIRERVPDVELALEIHEGALAEPHVIAELKSHLDELDIRLALDDFGLGERFLQLAEVPPHYLKFDMSLVKDLVDASSSKRRLLSMLMAAAREVGAQPIAEGIETEKEAGVCVMMGFTLAQGYLYSEPASLADVTGAGADSDDTLEQPAEEVHEKCEESRQQ